MKQMRSVLTHTMNFTRHGVVFVAKDLECPSHVEIAVDFCLSLQSALNGEKNGITAQACCIFHTVLNQAAVPFSVLALHYREPCGTVSKLW